MIQDVKSIVYPMFPVKGNGSINWYTRSAVRYGLARQREHRVRSIAAPDHGSQHDYYNSNYYHNYNYADDNHYHADCSYRTTDNCRVADNDNGRTGDYY